MNDMHPEWVALDAATRSGLVPPGVAREALERHAALAQAGQTVNLLALAAERLDPRAREALAAFVRGARETVDGPAPSSGGGRSGAPRASSTFGESRPAASLPGPGDRVASYTIERELGRGGMGAVFAAVSATGQRVALKLLLEVTDGPTAERFLREANAARKLQHPGIVALHEAGVDERGRQFMAMQLVDGESLRDRLEREGPLPSREAARITLEVARALEHAHAQFVLHRDLKPHNVLLAKDGRALLADFGLARDAHDTRLTNTGELLGTPAYMAPEQAAGERRNVDARSDVYGLGATLYHMLAGRPPFEGPTIVNIVTSVLTRRPAPPSSKAKDVDPALEALCLACLEKSPGDRPPSASSLGHELARWLSTSSPAPRRGKARLKVGALALAALAGAVLAVKLTPSPEPEPEPEAKVVAAVATSSAPVPAPSVEPTTPAPPAPAAIEEAVEEQLPTPGPRDERRIDASSFRSHRNLELRNAWMIDDTAEGLWLRGPGEARTRTGLCLQLTFMRESSFEVEADVLLARLEPSLPLGIVWKQEANRIASLGLVAQWTQGPGGVAVMEHRLTLRYQIPGDADPVQTVAGPAVALPPGPSPLTLRLRYDVASGKLVGSTKDGVLGSVALELVDRLPPGSLYVSVWLQPGEVFRPEPARLWATEASEVLVRSFRVATEPAAVEDGVRAWGAAHYGWLGRRSTDEQELPSVLVEVVDPATLKALNTAATEALFMAAMRCAGHDSQRGRAMEFLQRAALNAGGEAKLWSSRRHDVFALGPHQRQALREWLETWNKDHLVDVLEPENDFAAARARLREAEAVVRARLRDAQGAGAVRIAEQLKDNLRAQAFVAYRLRDFAEAQRLWRENEPTDPVHARVFRGLPAHLR